MEIIGKTPINPLLFYTGKISGYLLWVLLILELINIPTLKFNNSNGIRILSVVVLCCGLILTVASLYYLGGSTRLGLPSEKTVLKSEGIYRYSRNPMYLGFALFTIASMIYYQNEIIICLGIYSLIVYHLIILKEEKFLENRFGVKYLEYKKEVRRYI